MMIEGRADRGSSMVRIVAHAALDGKLIVLGGMTCLMAFLVGAWWVAFLGAFGYGALVLRKAFQPAFAREVLAAEVRPALPPPDELGDPDLRCIARSLSAARQRFDTLVGESVVVTPYLGSLVGAVQSLEEAAGVLLRRTDDLATSIRALDRSAVLADQHRLTSLVALAVDPGARAEYERALQIRREDLRVLDGLSAYQSRVSARLWLVVASLEGLPARIIHMRLMDSRARQDLSAELDDALQRMRSELVLSEQTFVGLLPAAG